MSGKTWLGEVGMRNRRPTALWGMCQDPWSGEHGPSPGNLAPHGRLAFSSPPHGSAQGTGTDGHMHPSRVLAPHALPGRGLAGSQLCTSPPPQPSSSFPTGSFKLRTLPPLQICSPSPFPAPGQPRVPSPTTAGAEDNPRIAASHPSPKPFQTSLPPRGGGG